MNERISEIMSLWLNPDLILGKRFSLRSFLRFSSLVIKLSFYLTYGWHVLFLFWLIRCCSVWLCLRNGADILQTIFSNTFSHFSGGLIYGQLNKMSQKCVREGLIIYNEVLVEHLSEPVMAYRTDSTDSYMRPSASTSKVLHVILLIYGKLIQIIIIHYV